MIVERDIGVPVRLAQKYKCDMGGAGICWRCR